MMLQSMGLQRVGHDGTTRLNALTFSSQIREIWSYGEDRTSSLHWLRRKQVFQTSLSILIQGMHFLCVPGKLLKMKVLVTLSCLTLCNTVDSSPPGSSVCGILQARILGWVAISSSRVFPKFRDWSPGLLHCRRIVYCCATRDLSSIQALKETFCEPHISLCSSAPLTYPSGVDAGALTSVFLHFHLARNIHYCLETPCLQTHCSIGSTGLLNVGLRHLPLFVPNSQHSALNIGNKWMNGCTNEYRCWIELTYG